MSAGVFIHAELQPKRNALLRNETAVVKVTVKGGTPEGCESLCRSCARGHIITGFRASDEEVFCRTFFFEREIRFPVRECTLYEDKRLASKTEMEEIAWHLRSTTSKPYPTLGFVGSTSASTEPGKTEADLPSPERESS
jgi:hypothetical protein